MSNDTHTTKPRHHGPGPRVAEKPKDLKNAVTKLKKYLHNLLKLIVISAYFLEKYAG